jgi:hemerythrin-like metal-binding protein
VGWIDDQHRQLAAIINESIAARVLPRGETVIADLMERFLGHVCEHFAAEERQLEAWGIPVLPHRAEHLRLLEEVETLAAAAGGDHKVLVNHYLRFWMIDHIRDSDLRDFAGQKTSFETLRS